MHLKKRTVTVIVIFLFLASLALLLSNIFVIPPGAGEEYYMDKLFYFCAIVVFWLCVPFLLSKLIRKVIWKSEFTNSMSAGSVGRIEDLSVIAIYFFCIGIIVIKIINVQFTFSIVLLYLALMGITVFLRPRVLKMTKTGFIQSARPFKVGDWIGLINQNGNTAFTGRIINFDAKSVQLKSPENTLLIVPNSHLSGYIVENYNALNREIILSITYQLNSGVRIEHAKRIFTSAVKDALREYSPNLVQSPEILVSKILKDVVEYKINFPFCPWITATPDSLKDKIFTKIRMHLYFAGIDFGYIENRNNILKDAGIFNLMKESEIEELHKSSAVKLFNPGEVIIEQGESGSSMYILAEGLLNVTVKDAAGTGLRVGSISPGQFFGEMSLFTGEDRSATVTSETESVTIEIFKDSLKKIMDKRPELVNGFSEVIAERQRINMKILDDSLNSRKTFAAKIASSIRSFFNMKS